MKTLGVCLLGVFLGASSASAQTPDPELIQRLVDRVGQLERRVAELEAERAATAATSPTKAAVAAGPTAVVPADAAPHAQTRPDMPDMPGMSAPPVIDNGASSRPTLQLAGFSDFDFAASTDNKTHSGFAE